MLRAMPSSLLRQDTFLGCQSKLGWVPCLHHAMARRASVQQYLAERHTPAHSLLHSSPYDIHDGQCLFSQGKSMVVCGLSIFGSGSGYHSAVGNGTKDLSRTPAGLGHGRIQRTLAS